MTVVSSLAEGADQLVAEAGVAMGARLEVVLPLAKDDYRADFAVDRSRARFAALLAQAASVTYVPGTRVRPEAYAAASEMVLQRSDVMLALWDGQPARGSGGTAETVDATGAARKPLAWIEVGRPGDDIPSPAAVVRQMPARVPILGGQAFESLDWFNRQAVNVTGSEVAPQGFPQAGPAACYTLPYFLRADQLAARMQRRFRAMSRALYVLSVVAIGIAAYQIVFEPSRPSIVWGEFATLAVIVALLLFGKRTRLLERWLAARFLAERIRALAFLVDLSDESSLYAATPDSKGDSPVNEWMRRAMSELWIRTPRSTTDLNVLFETARTRLAEEWVRPQVAYHSITRTRSALRQRTFLRVAVSLFVVSIVAAFVHSTRLLEHDPDYIAFISLIVPAVAAALGGYSAQRDYARDAIRSETMARSLAGLIDEVNRADTLEGLRQVAQRIDITMQGEAVDWYAAARLREPEVP